MVDWDGLENRCTRKGTVSSNLTPSAKILLKTVLRPRGVFLEDIAGARGAWPYGSQIVYCPPVTDIMADGGSWHEG